MDKKLLDQRLRRALDNGRQTDVRLALEVGANPDTVLRLSKAESRVRGTSQTTALGAALIRKQWDSAEILLGYGDDPWSAPAYAGPRDPPLSVTGGVPHRTSSAWEAIVRDGFAHDDAAFEWLASRYPRELRPVSVSRRPDGGAGVSVWEMLAQRAEPGRLLQVMDAYRAERDGPIDPKIGTFLLEVALSKGALAQSPWMAVFSKLAAIDPHYRSDARFSDVAAAAVTRNNPYAFEWALGQMKTPLWKKSGDDGWAAAHQAARRGWGHLLAPHLAHASDKEVWHLALSASQGSASSFKTLLAVRPGVVAAHASPGETLTTVLGRPDNLSELPAIITALAEAGFSFDLEIAGRTPLAHWGSRLAREKDQVGRPVAQRTAEAVAVALSRAGAPLDDTAAALLRAHPPLDEWVARREGRSLRAVMATAPSQAPRRARL